MGRNGGDSCTEVNISPPSKVSPSGDIENASVREKIKVFSGGSGGSIDSGDKVSPTSVGTGLGTGSSRRSPFNRNLSRGWSQADDREVKTRAEQPSASAKEAFAHFGRSPHGVGSGSRPDKSWVKSGVKGPDTAGGSSSAGGSAASIQNGATTSAAAAAAAATAAVATPTPTQLSSEQRKAFVKQYSQSGASDYEGESDYSVHDNAAAAAVAATFSGPDTPANGRKRPSPLSASNDPSSEVHGSDAANRLLVKNMSDSESPHLLK